MSDLTEIVRKYHVIYSQDPSLTLINNDFLNNEILYVFGPVDDQKGVLIAEAIEEINNIAGLACSEDFLEMQDLCSSFGQPPQQRRRRQEMEPIFPSSSNAREMAKFRREFGYMGPIAVQFSRDLQLLPLLEEDKQWLVLNVGPSSDKYLAIAEHPSHFRR